MPTSNFFSHGDVWGRANRARSTYSAKPVSATARPASPPLALAPRVDLRGARQGQADLVDTLQQHLPEHRRRGVVEGHIRPST